MRNRLIHTVALARRPHADGSGGNRLNGFKLTRDHDHRAKATVRMREAEKTHLELLDRPPFPHSRGNNTRLLVSSVIRIRRLHDCHQTVRRRAYSNVSALLDFDYGHRRVARNSASLRRVLLDSRGEGRT